MSRPGTAEPLAPARGALGGGGLGLAPRRRLLGAADAAGPSEGPAGVDVRQLEADDTAWVAGDGEERQREQQAEEE